jgi:hypothetical protein
MSKKKVQVQGFKLDNAAIHAWIRNDCDLFPTASASSLKIKAQNNFKSTVQRKPRLVMACPGQSQRLAEKSQSDKPTKAKAKAKSKPPPAVVPPSVPSTSATESDSSRRRLLEDFLFSDVGDALLLQIAQDHPLHASCSALCKRSGPKPLRIALGHTFAQTPCVVTLRSRRAGLIGGMTDRLQVRHLLRENGNGSIGVRIQGANNDPSATEIFILWKEEAFTHPRAFEVWGHAPAKLSFRQLSKKGQHQSSRCQPEAGDQERHPKTNRHGASFAL